MTSKDTEVWDSVTGEKLLTLYSTLSPGYVIDYSPDGKYIIG